MAALLPTPRGMVLLPPIPLDPTEVLGSLRTLLERWQRTLRIASVIKASHAEPAAIQDTFQDLLAAQLPFSQQAPTSPALEQLRPTLRRGRCSIPSGASVQGSPP